MHRTDRKAEGKRNCHAQHIPIANYVATRVIRDLKTTIEGHTCPIITPAAALKTSGNTALVPIASTEIYAATYAQTSGKAPFYDIRVGKEHNDVAPCTLNGPELRVQDRGTTAYKLSIVALRPRCVGLRRALGLPGDGGICTTEERLLASNVSTQKNKSSGIELMESVSAEGMREVKSRTHTEVRSAVTLRDCRTRRPAPSASRSKLPASCVEYAGKKMQTGEVRHVSLCALMCIHVYCRQYCLLA